MKKYLGFIAVLLAILLIASTGLAVQARFFRDDQDQDYHSSHLSLHIGSMNCSASGNHLKMREEPGGKKILGYLETGDIFILEDIFGQWAKVSVDCPAATSKESYTGLTGWVDADYIECPCSESQYRSNTPSFTYSLAETLNKSTTIREKADKGSRSLAKLKKGEQVEVISEYTGSDRKIWYRVRYDGRIAGYIRSDLVSITAENLPEQQPGKEEAEYDPFEKYPAPTEEEKIWIKAYQTFSWKLNEQMDYADDKAGEWTDSFGNTYYKEETILVGLYDLNNDGTPEFLATEGFIQDSGVNCVYVYTVSDGQVKYTGSAPTRIYGPAATGSPDYPGIITLYGNMGVVLAEYFTLDENLNLAGELIYESDSNDPNDPEGNIDPPKITVYTDKKDLYEIAKSGSYGDYVLTIPLEELRIDPCWPGFVNDWKK